MPTRSKYIQALDVVQYTEVAETNAEGVQNRINQVVETIGLSTGYEDVKDKLRQAKLHAEKAQELLKAAQAIATDIKDNELKIREETLEEQLRPVEQAPSLWNLYESGDTDYETALDR